MHSAKKASQDRMTIGYVTHQLPGLRGLALELGGVASSSPAFILRPNCAESHGSRPNATILKTAEPMLPP